MEETFEKRYFRKDHEKVNYVFPFASSPFLCTRLLKTEKAWNSLSVSISNAKHTLRNYFFSSNPLNLETAERK